ncbi:MAG: hypothetical protein KKH98_09815 [Spirochaetes bacterium]|nr:hypothetical protein [Spirochaetota bacterium]
MRRNKNKAFINEKSIQKNYYFSKKKKILRFYQMIEPHIINALQPHYHESETADILHSTRSGMIRLIPEIPYIGGDKNPFFTQMLIDSVPWLSLYKVLKKQGRSDEHIGEIIGTAFRSRIFRWPRILLSIIV